MAEWTKKRARQGGRRRLEKIEKSLQELGYNWGDLVEMVDEAAEQLNAIREAMDEAVEEDEERSRMGEL